MIIDPVELNVLQGNAEFQSLFGYSEFDNKKLNILQLFSKDEYPRLIDGMKRFGLHGIETISNWQQVKRDGSTFTSQLSIHPLRWMNENCFLVLVTPQEKGEKPLYRIQEERYREVVNKQIDLIVRFTREGMITFVNQAFCEFSQQSAEQLIGRPVGERIHEQDMEIFQRHLSLISTQQPIRKSQNRMIDGFGRLRTIQWLDRGIFDGDQLLEFQGVGQDISEAVSEQILKETMEQRYRGLVEEIQGVVYLLHAETFMIIYINPQFEKLSGYSLEEIYQDPSLWERSIPPDDMLRIRASLQNRRRQIAGEIIEFQFRHKDGHIIWAQERGSLIVSNDGTAFLQGVVVDISAAQVARQKLELYSRLGRALNDFSLALMKVKAEQWNGLVNAILQEIGKELQMDRAYILMIDFEQETVNNTHEWCADGIESSMGDFQNLPLHQFDWWAEHLQQDGKIIIEDLSTLLPAEAAIREMMESQSVQSILVVALKLEDQYYGCIGFDSVKTPKIFDQEVIPILRIFSDMLMSTYERLGLGRFQPTDFSPTN
jgi:PAS domain S-box-containing protein